MSTIIEDDVTRRIAARVRELRAERGYSLDALAARSGVSRSAISTIERATASPTAVVLDKLATGLGVPLASLFDAPADRRPPGPIARRADQPEWRDPASGYLRRQLSPPDRSSPIQLVEVEFPPGAAVAYESHQREADVHQQVWVLEGRIDVTVGDDVHELATGDCLAMRLDRPTAFRNPGDAPARYAVVVAALPQPTRRAS
ncbi:MAG TPA: helix-turn-helix domain-containing protein [Acidimicrobiales bacterium]